MQTVELHTAKAQYKVLVAASIEQLSDFVDLQGSFAVVDQSVSDRWKAANPGCDSFFVEAGESIKTISRIEHLYKEFLARQLDKKSTIIAVGGGALTDAVCFAASTFHRGISCVTVPSTLLAQVDASIGGKNGINFAGVKNLIGTIVQPKLVCCDLSFLKTLPEALISHGMAEVIKAAVISDPDLFNLVSQNYEAVFNLDEAILEQVLYKAVSVKAGIVSRDEDEKSERMKLNLGHTIGHALEASLHIEHGQAVAYGMLLESQLAANLGICDKTVEPQIKEVCRKYKLETETVFNPEEIFTLMLQDKKKRAGKINFALPTRIGDVQIFPIETDEIRKHLSNLRLA